MASAERNIRARGEMLKLVRRFGGTGISTSSLDQIFQQVGMFAALSSVEENLEYLQGKGYLTVAFVKDQLSGVERWLVRITPLGIDLIDGTIPADPGVEIVC